MDIRARIAADSITRIAEDLLAARTIKYAQVLLYASSNPDHPLEVLKFQTYMWQCPCPVRGAISSYNDSLPRRLYSAKASGEQIATMPARPVRTL